MNWKCELQTTIPMATAYSVNHTGKKNSCNSCYGSNKPDVNWCIHCGTAMIGEKIKHIQAPLKLEPKASLSSTHQCQEYVTTTNTLSSRCSKKQSNIKEPANRYWEMSKCYAWRKPRSNLNKVKYRSASPSDLSKSSDVCTYNSEEKNQHHEVSLMHSSNFINLIMYCSGRVICSSSPMKFWLKFYRI